MLYLGYVLLRYLLIYNLEVSFNFHLTFLQLNVIKMFTVQKKLFFTLLSVIFFELPVTRTPDNSNFFSISPEGSSYRESTVSSNMAIDSFNLFVSTFVSFKINSLKENAENLNYYPILRRKVELYLFLSTHRE